MASYFMIMDYTLDITSIWDMKSSLEDFNQAYEFLFIFLFWYVHVSEPQKTYQKEIYSLKFKVTPTKGLIGETNSPRL